MKVLALTHAHLHPDGLSPVSCERADSIVGAWAERLNWDVDVVYTSGTKWRGIWPEGQGLKVNISIQDAPQELRMGAADLFSTTLQTLINKRQFASAASLVNKRVGKRLRKLISKAGFALPHDLMIAKKWGLFLSRADDIKSQRFDFVFVCVGHGDEYLLQTALTLSTQLGIPMIADFRDLWSEHHVPGRFTAKQRQQIHRLEQKLLVNTKLISVPQKHMVKLLKKWAKAPVHLVPHGAYTDSSWADGQVIGNEFTMLYAGKLYPDGPGLHMLLELIKKLSQDGLYKPIRCLFFVDDTDMLHRLAQEHGITSNVSVNGWLSPAALWQHMRSAHLLLIPDAGVAADFPLLPTKTFQYAYTGRKILSLSPYKNPEMEEFLETFDAGKAFIEINEAEKWIAALSFEKSLYEVLPQLRDVPLRADVAVEFGHTIEKVLAGGNI